jgi:hypothetical protein
VQLKAVDDKQPDIDALQALLARPDVDERMRRRIEDQIWAVRDGAKAERDAAYEIEFHLGENRHFMTIHDLRIDVEGVVAQIDHLVISPVLEIFVCESKRFGAGVKINDHGEWTTFKFGRPVGVGSPIEQNRRHILALERAIKLGYVRLPRRVGLVPMKPTFHSRILVSKEGTITRPRKVLPELAQVMKVDQFRTRLLERDISTRAILKFLTTDQLVTLGRQFVALHQPASRSWESQFGLAPLASPIVPEPPAPPPRSSGHHCASCGAAVSFAVVKFCWVNKARFDGQVYCMPCQQVVAPLSAHR